MGEGEAANNRLVFLRASLSRVSPSGCSYDDLDECPHRSSRAVADFERINQVNRCSTAPMILSHLGLQLQSICCCNQCALGLSLCRQELNDLGMGSSNTTEKSAPAPQCTADLVAAARARAAISE